MCIDDIKKTFFHLLGYFPRGKFFQNTNTLERILKSYVEEVNSVNHHV